MVWYLDNNDTLLLNNREVYGGRYYKADYIEFDWANNGGYIDIGMTDGGNVYTWTIDFEYLEVGESYICATVYHPSGVTWTIGSINSTTWYYGQGQYSYTIGSSSTSHVANQKIRAVKRPWGGGYPFTNNIFVGAANWSQEGTTPPTVLQGSNSHFRLYSFLITNGSTPIATMYPAYDTVNGEWGLYDTTRQQFFGNAGAAGTSIAGGYYPDAVTLTPEVLAFDYDDPPASMWYLNHEEIIVNGLIPDPLIDDQGAFNKCTHLVEVEIPASVTSIGRYSFRETQLKKVKISSNCTYYDTSFPDDCVISFYPS